MPTVALYGDKSFCAAEMELEKERERDAMMHCGGGGVAWRGRCLSSLSALPTTKGVSDGEQENMLLMQS
jgi:hypothetical protein